MNEKIQSKPFIGIVPYELRKIKNLGEILITELESIQNNNQPDKRIKDLIKSDHIIVYPSKIRAGYRGFKCKISLMIAEPKAIEHRFYNKIWFLRWKFHTIFICYTELANKYKNVVVVPIASCWIPELHNEDFLNKDKLISIIASDKKFLIGHKLRHQIIKQITDKNIDVLGRVYAPFKDKKDGLLPYYFSIVIENCQETDYFTEKIIDAFACKTVPIYWGCPNISNYFDVEGIIIFNTIEELKIILDNLTIDDYQKYMKAMEKNIKTSKKLTNTIKLMSDKLRH